MFRFWFICPVLVASLVGIGGHAFLKSHSQDPSKDSEGAVALRQENAPRPSQHAKATKIGSIDVSETLQQFERATQPSISPLIQAKRYEEARSALVERIKDSPEDEAIIEELAFLLADKLNEKEEARLLFQQLLELNPENTLALGLYKDLSTSRSAKEQAAEFLSAQADRCHSCSDLQLVAAEFLIEGRRSSEASALLDALGESLLTESQARHLSSLYRHLNRTDLAHYWLEKAVELATEATGSGGKSSSIWRDRDRAMLNQLANDSRHGI